MCVCVWVCVWGGGKGGVQRAALTSLLLPPQTLPPAPCPKATMLKEEEKEKAQEGEGEGEGEEKPVMATDILAEAGDTGRKKSTEFTDAEIEAAFRFIDLDKVTSTGWYNREGGVVRDGFSPSQRPGPKVRP